MENACKEVRSRQTFPWQAVAFYGGIGKNVYIKSLLFSFVQEKVFWPAMVMERRRKKTTVFKMFYREKISL